MEEKKQPARRQRTAPARPAADQAPAGAAPVRRRRRKQKPPVKALAICAAIIFAVGFLLGFLVRGCTVEDTTASTGESQSAGEQLPGDNSPAVQTQPSQPEPATDWRLILVSPENPLPEGYTVELTRLSGGMEIDKRCYSDLQNLLAACKAAGYSPAIVTAYVSREAQQAMCGEPGSTAAQPGHSEHQTGLALDIVDASNQNLDESQRSSAIGAWLVEHAWEYGFIQRYPESAANETGVEFEPWHYRYVGLDAAKAIHDAGVTLEGYLGK